MPALPNAPRTLRIRLTGLNQTTIFQHVQYVQYSIVPPLSADLSSFSASVATLWNSFMAPLMNTTVRLNLVETQDISSPTGAFGSSNIVQSGTRAGTPMPVQVAAVATWHVNYHWRGGHPRTYWPAGVQTDVVNGKTWATPFQTAMSSALASYISGMNAITVGGSPVGIFSAVRYFSNNALMGVPLVLPITASSFHTRVDTQRRRLGREIT